MPTTYITLTRLKRICLHHIEQAGAEGVPVTRISRHVARSLARDEQIIRRDDRYISSQHK